MKKSRFFKLFILVCILAVAVVFIGMNFAQAQSQTKGKPPDKGKPKPPDLEYECNYNGNCEWEDYQAGSCPDCDPKTYPPLVLDQQPQIVAPSFNRIFQYKYDFGDGKFHDTWASNQFYEEEKI
ncbi:MAG: hypothetical protein GTN53_29235, partial [Candidatus Aminicenantes bacterium]|nr:hypothetical protein [Candidatus Aminicenantes bacterium]NIQ70558.1 hypothetical protein [Candidatus Aminicenantes bacterium]NIT26599.1 hypothetical protein [Candidatus Aminicenantes bacterium]